jgi:2-oxoisovalerate dehydrogenase E1 component alpha subunit
MKYTREQRRPFMLEAKVSRLYGHSSSSGALRVKDEPDPIELFEAKLLDAGVIDQPGLDAVHEEALAEVEAAVEQALAEQQPTPEDIEKFTYAPSSVDVVYPDDYTGLPGA